MNLDTNSSVRQAIEEWSYQLGESYVQHDRATISLYSRSTGDEATIPVAILLPNSVEQIQHIIAIASKYQIALYPISGGKNYGYGDACAATHGQAIVDLKRMNRILEVNKRLGYVVVEPGVTQGQLSQFLKKHRTGLWMDATGAGPTASIIGNALERGYGHTHYADHFKTMGALQVVLANGDVLNTGFGHFPNAKAAHVYNYGIGPILDGLFTQSNFGIVTRMTLWLSPEPEDFCTFICWLDEDEDLFRVVDILSRLKLQGVLQSNVHIGNDLRVIASRGRFPWHLAKDDQPLPEDVRASLRRKYSAKKWVFTGAFYGTKEHVQASRKTLKKALTGYKVNYLTDKSFEKAESFVARLTKFGLGDIDLTKTLKEKIGLAKPLFQLLKGIPTAETLKGAAWKTKLNDDEKNYEPLAAGSGILWQAPVIPAHAECVQELLNTVTPIYHKYGFDCPVTFSMINERSLICVTNVVFDKKDSEETARALQCYKKLGEVLTTRGFYPYRTSVSGIQHLQTMTSPYWDVISKIKKALDPQNILSPGHYVPNKK